MRRSVLFFTFVLFSPASGRAAYDVEALKSDMSFFADLCCTRLKRGVTRKDLLRFKSALLKKTAERLLEGTYEKTYRAARYRAYASSRALQKRLKLGDGFSRYENITGIYLEAGEHVLLVGDTGGRRISLLIPDWLRKPPPGIPPARDPNGWGLKRQKIKLKPGLNIVRVRKGGNAYLSYFDDEPDRAPEVTVHFLTGKVNGYFDVSKHTNADWELKNQKVTIKILFILDK